MSDGLKGTASPGLDILYNTVFTFTVGTILFFGFCLLRRRFSGVYSSNLFPGHNRQGKKYASIKCRFKQFFLPLIQGLQFGTSKKWPVLLDLFLGHPFGWSSFTIGRIRRIFHNPIIKIDFWIITFHGSSGFRNSFAILLFTIGSN